MEDLRISASAQREKAAGGAQPGGSTLDSGAGASPTLSGLPDDNLCLRVALVGRRAPASQRDRWGTPRAAHPPGKREQRSLRALARSLPDDAATTLADSSPSGLDVS